MNNEKCFVFISTLEHLPWGGCEELWYKTALIALKHKNSVCVLVFKHHKTPAHLTHLIENGAVVFFIDRPGEVKSLVVRAKRKFLQYSIQKKILQEIDKYLKQFGSKRILISQAGGFDFSYSYLDIIKDWIINNKFSFSIVVHNVPDVGIVVGEEGRKKQIEIYDLAKSVAFVAKRNMLSSQRILANKIANATLINNPLNFNKYPDYIEYPKSEDIVRFAVVAALRCFHKGQDVLLQVLSSKLWKERAWELNFYGEGPDADYLKKLVSFYSLDERVNFLGHKADVIEIWNKNHIHILPSLGEGTPLALIESMYCGRAAITTDVGGNADYAIHLENSFVTYYPTLPALTEVLEIAWQNRNNWEPMGMLARKKIIETYDLVPEINLYNQLNA
jgi:L-malate glycosyltransferase